MQGLSLRRTSTGSALVIKRITSLILTAIILVAVLAGCADSAADNGEVVVFTSFRDIPGVTQAEIDAIGELQRTRRNFNFSSIYGTEMFIEDGRARGFSALMCSWLSELFEIPFVPSIVQWDELIEGLEDGSIHFTGELGANDERRETLFMTDDIAQRQIITLR